MKLTVIERLMLLNVLPAEGDFTTIKLVRQLREELSYTEEEHTLLKFRQEGEQTFWDKEGEAKIGVREFPIGEKMNDMIVGVFKKLDEEKKLTEQHFTLYEKFMA